MAFNVEAFDINKDGKKDIIIGNWNDTYVYFGGKGRLDSTADVIYKGRLLAVCDYNGDGYKDLITMHLTKYDSTLGRTDYDGEILFYYGSNTTTLAIDTLPEYSIPLPTKYPIRDEFSLGGTGRGVACGDFNKDGKTDIVISSLYALPDLVGVLYIYMGNTIPSDSATFQVRGRAYVPGNPPIGWYGNYFQVGDINGDGYSDLLLSAKVDKVPLPPSGDSIEVIYIYLGGSSFSFVENGESIKYESKLIDDFHSAGWVRKEFSVMDINGDGISDLLVSHYYEDSKLHVHFGSKTGIDTIPSFYLTDPDTTRSDVIAGQVCEDIGDFNHDGYDDFILKVAAYKSFSVHLGGPRLSNRNPYGMRGLLESYSTSFPTKAIGCGDQNGDGVDDYVAIAASYVPDEMGYALIFLGDPTQLTGVNECEIAEPAMFNLFQNYPNPFNPQTTIEYALEKSEQVHLTIFDVLGREVNSLVNKQEQAGRHRILWYGKDKRGLSVASGIYYYQLHTPTRTETKKAIFLK